ncbi:hypothetical protein DRH27_02080 [Candidatus Falkowbacteria bacterium]|nr:MAG: hypothetical protein DRH27_02080 [Candidatus Falkowbacteria bacterium]
MRRDFRDSQKKSGGFVSNGPEPGKYHCRIAAVDPNERWVQVGVLFSDDENQISKDWRQYIYASDNAPDWAVANTDELRDCLAVVLGLMTVDQFETGDQFNINWLDSVNRQFCCETKSRKDADKKIQTEIKGNHVWSIDDPLAKDIPKLADAAVAVPTEADEFKDF